MWKILSERKWFLRRVLKKTTPVNSEIQNYFSICGKSTSFQSKAKQPLAREELPNFSFQAAFGFLAALGLDFNHDYCHLGWLVLRYQSQDILQLAFMM